jgi:hypothetical protein
MSKTTWTHSVASLSWINPKTGLPEVDPRDPDSQSRSSIVSTIGYRFANFLEAFITVDDDSGYIVGHGFTKASGIYRGLSYARLPTAFWLPIQSVRLGQEPVVFTQIVGAQTKSPELLGGLVGPIGELVAHNVSGFPPIWTELQLSMYSDGTFDTKILRYSIFPSINAYREVFIFEKDPITGKRFFWKPKGDYSPIHKYDAVPHLEEWKKRGWGRITDAAKSGPVGGNPFNVEFTAIDYESWVPKGPAY